jgi:uridine monophosphate synthetase
LQTGKSAYIADRLFEVGAVQFGAFRLKLHETQPDAPLSPIYLNLRTSDNPKPGPLTEELVLGIGSLLYEKLSEILDLEFRYVAGLPRAGDPLADEFMEYSHHWGTVTRLRLEKEETSAGRRIARLIDEPEEPGKALIIDDLITQADTKIEAIEVLKAAGVAVSDLVVLVDREQGGAAHLRLVEGVRVISAFRLSELLDHYVATGKISQAKAEEVKEYQAANIG